MAVKKKPILHKIGKHFIDLNDVACIKEANARLYIIHLKSQPNPDFPIWVDKKDIESILSHFEIKVND